MPTFPEYQGELPPCLNPLKPRHWLLLAYWIYFQPTALKSYLYQADPDLYRTGEGLGIFRSWKNPAYRNLYLSIPATTILLTVIVGLPIILLASWLQATPVDWFGMAFGVAYGVAGGVAGSVAGGVAGGMAFGVAGGVAFGVAGGVAFGVAIGVAVSLVRGVAFVVAVGVAFCVAFGMAFGVAGGMAFGVAGGMAGGVAVGVAGGMAFGVAGGMAGGVAVGVAVVVAVGVGALRLPLWLIEQGLIVFSFLPQVKHPLIWDELSVLPLLQTKSYLIKQLERNETQGLRFLGKLASNPFQRWAIQGALFTYLLRHPTPLNLLYFIATDPYFAHYVVAPIEEKNWRQGCDLKLLFLSELTGVICIDCSGDNDKWVYNLTQPLRHRQKTPLTDFAGLLFICDLLNLDNSNIDSFNLASSESIYKNLSSYPYGEEIAETFELIATFLKYQELTQLAQASQNIYLSNLPDSFLNDQEFLRPSVIQTLQKLRKVGAEISTYLASTSRVNQLSAITRSTDQLKEIRAYIENEVNFPEKYLLFKIVQQWSDLIVEKGGEIGQEQNFQPIVNPYIAGNPVIGNLFVGREDILRRLEELWSKSTQCESVILYGHRRMGKSSILKNLGTRFGDHTIIVDFNMQGEVSIQSNDELLYDFAISIYDSLPDSLKNQLKEPPEEHFNSNSFKRFLKQLNDIRKEYRWIIAIDEFEIIEQKIKENKLSADLLDLFRYYIQTYPWLILAFAGLHTLGEMCQDYWNPLFSSVTAINISFLTPSATKKLLIAPAPDFSIDYDLEAIEIIIKLTNGQPYLVQLIGRELVTRFNRQVFEENVKKERRFTLVDVETIINSEEFYQDGNAYFTGVWGQAEHSSPQGQLNILKKLAIEPLNLMELVNKTGLNIEEVEGALSTLKNHDVINFKDEKYNYNVELMRRWVKQNYIE